MKICALIPLDNPDCLNYLTPTLNKLIIGIIINFISSSYKISFYLLSLLVISKISDHQQSWGYEDGPWKGLRPPLLVVADLSQFISHRYQSVFHPEACQRGNGRTY